MVDPESGRPAETDVASVTVIAPAAWRAEVLATAALLGGAADAPRYLEGQGVQGLVVDRAGHVAATFELPTQEVA